MTKKSRRDSEACLRIPQLPCEVRFFLQMVGRPR